MTDVWGCGYLSGLPDGQRDELARVNAPGLTALRAAPRGLVPAYCTALATRAHVRAAQAAAVDVEPDLLFQGRDAADAALRLASRHHLPWHELGALRAQADLDHAEGTDRGWAAKAAALHARLVPPGLDPDPLATVEKQVKAQRAAGRRKKEGND
jgi:hypothetical protein